MNFPSFHTLPYNGSVYRNIATCDPRQNLYDDLTDEPDKLDQLVQATSGIDHAPLEMHRPFQYGALDDDLLRVFQREHWGLGRFGDGQEYGVWYAAEEELTSIYEAAYRAFRLAQDNVLPHGEVYAADRSMYHAKLQATRMLDVTTWNHSFQQLVHPRDYSYCQSLGKEAHCRGVELLRSPSARRVDGICTPVFEVMAIKEGTARYSIHLHIRPNGRIAIDSSQRLCLTLEGRDLENPYGIA